MSTFEDLLKRLDAAGRAGWEDEYSRAPVELTRDQASEVVRSERTYAMWFAFRFDAGPPGEQLPTQEAAFEAVLFGKMGSPLDAYRVVFASSPVPEAAPGDLRLALLCNATACALKRGVSWFATWLAARAGLAAIALGSPERAWLFLDGLTNEGRRHPNLDKLAIFEPLRRSEVAQRSAWVRSAIARLWPSLDVPVLPSLPFPDLAGHAVSLGETLSELSRIGATQVRALVESFVQSMDSAYIDRHANDPLVRSLRIRALDDTAVPPPVNDVPDWFPDWARAVARAGDTALAREAGLVLLGTGSGDQQLGAMLVLRAARVADLEMLAAGLGAPELKALCAELVSACGSLPTAVADALVAVAVPRHVRRFQALGVLAEHLPLLTLVEAASGGAVDHVQTMMQTLVEERHRDREANRPVLNDMTTEIRRVAGRLSTFGRRLSAADVERAALKIPVPNLTTGLLELATEASSGLPALERLLLLLALRREASQPEYKENWSAPLARLASGALQDLAEPELFELRIRLLDEAILSADGSEPTAELYFQRANMQRATSRGDERSTELALADLNMAIRRARAEGNPGLCAAATAALVKLLASRACVEGDERSKELANAEAALEEVLELNLKPIDGAVVHQARAHLVRLRNPEESLVAFETALALLVPNEPFWCELAAEIVSTLVRVDRVEEAVTRGTDYVDQARSDELGTELGMLHLALGEALVESDRLDDARRQLERGLHLLRGRDPHNEALARIHLARLGLTVSDSALVDEHLRFLSDHRAQLHPILRRDLDLLEASASGRRGDTVGQRALLTRRLAIENDERVRLGLRLEIAWLDVTEGRPRTDLDGLVLLGLETKLGRHFDVVLTSLLCDHGRVLAPSTREQALPWASQRQPSILASLQKQLGRTELAQSTLRSALAGHLADRERLNCTHQLMTLLGNEHPSELRTLCAQLERLLHNVEDVPHARLDLAEMMRRTAGDDLSVLRRARGHVLRALEVDLTSLEHEFGHRTMGWLTVDLLRLSQPHSSAPLAQDASWLLQELALGEPEASQLRFGAAYLLLLLGPVTHPDAVGAAGRLLDLVTVPPDQQAFAPMLRRHRWIQGLVGLATPVELPSGEANGPFDHLPSWLADHVLGRHRSILPDELAQAAEVIEDVVRARPDVADTLLSVIVSAQHLLSRGPRDDLLRAVYSAIQSVSAIHTESWPRLREALDALSTKDHHPTVANLRSATRRLSFPDVPKIAVRAATDGGSPHIAVGQLEGRQFARGCFERAVALMDGLQLDPDVSDAGLRLSEARSLLEKAVAIAREERTPDLFSFLVSSGNAWKLSPGEDVEKAFRLYESAAELAALPEQEAQLWKVQADALRLRGTADDLRRADALLEKSARIRRGSSLAATLISRAQVALVHPNLDKAARESRAASFAMDAVRAHREFCDQDGVIDFLLHRLSAWQRERPDDSTPSRFRKELGSIYPARTAEIDAPRPRATGREVESLVVMMSGTLQFGH